MARLGLALLLLAAPLHATERAAKTPAPRAAPSTPVKLAPSVTFTAPPSLPATVIPAPPAAAKAPAAGPVAPAHVPQVSGKPVAPLRAPLMRAFTAAGASPESLVQLGQVLNASYPEDPEATFHNRGRAEEDAIIAQELMSEAPSLSARWRATLLLAALLHAADPARDAGALPRAPGVQDHLERDPALAAVLKRFQEELSVDPAQVRALAGAMAYSSSEQGEKRVDTQFEEAVKKAFPAKDQGLARQWGGHLAFVARSAPLMTGTPAEAEERLKRLAAESRRSASAALGREVERPTDESMVASAWRRAKPLRESPGFALLPAELRGKLNGNLTLFEIVNDASRLPKKDPPQERGPPPTRSPLPAHPDVKTAVASLASLPADRFPDQPSAGAFRSLASRVLPRVQANAILTTETKRVLQSMIQEKIEAASREHLKRRGLAEKEVFSHGTDLKGLLGMLFEGGMRSTNRYAGGGRGFSGEGFHFWGERGAEVGASYGAARATKTRQAAVSVLLYNRENPFHSSGGQLNRAPRVETDFLAAVVSDGEWTVVLDKPALVAMARSSTRWRLEAVEGMRKGRPGEFALWQKFNTELDPEKQPDSTPTFEINEDDFR